MPLAQAQADNSFIYFYVQKIVYAMIPINSSIYFKVIHALMIHGKFIFNRS